MRVKIAGGCGEHGRNCFLIQGEKISFLVDCGLMAGIDSSSYPHLTNEEIQGLNYVFLTHSHLDHVGAYPWLVENGFNGVVVATYSTLQQLTFQIEKSLALENVQTLDGMKISYGKSGHCVGSVWYEFELEGKKLLFSGDYTENTQVYCCDEIIGRYADLAIVDCAYGSRSLDYQNQCQQIIKEISELKSKYDYIVLPVPKYGRGLELYALIKKYLPSYRIAADKHFIDQIQSMNSNDFKYCLDTDVILYKSDCQADIIFVSNPQLKTRDSQQIALEALKKGYGIMTGTVENGTLCDRLIRKGHMKMISYPVHLTKAQYLQVVSNNTFKHVIAYHCPSIDCEKEFEF